MAELAFPEAPTVSRFYIRITDEKGRRRYERVRPRSPQPYSPRDNYAVLYYVPKMTCEQVGQDYNEAVRRRAAKEHDRTRFRIADDSLSDPQPQLVADWLAFKMMHRTQRRSHRIALGGTLNKAAVVPAVSSSGTSRTP